MSSQYSPYNLSDVAGLVVVVTGGEYYLHIAISRFYPV